ncbi:hAT family dimerization protein [Ceratobasidium sp. AG-Ba]|nr:hAT family dimerization protein [Ceratobasidium sp. AG-Ba]
MLWSPLSPFAELALTFSGRHTGAALATTVYQVLTNFDIQDRVWGVVCDNASNNGEMMNRYKKFKMKRLTGPAARVHCIPHILNLASKAIAAPFVRKRAEADKSPNDDDAKQDGGLSSPDEADEFETDDEGDDDLDFGAEDETGEDDGTAPSRTLDEDDDDEDDDNIADIFVPEMPKGSREEKELRGTLKGLYKIAWLARKLRFSPRVRTVFQEACAELELPPHNVQRDVAPRWNSTAMMIKDAVRLEEGVFAFQKTGEVPLKKRLNREEFKAMKLLLKLLLPLTTLTEVIISKILYFLQRTTAYHMVCCGAL